MRVMLLLKLTTLLSIFALFEIVVVLNAQIPLNECKVDADCEAEGTHVKCMQNRCQCDESIGLIRESHSRSCALGVGRDCSDSSAPCVNNARCDVGTGTCLCDEPDFSATDHGTCALEYGRKCEDGPPLECNPFKFLKCNSATNSCSCVSHDHGELIYDTQRGTSAFFQAYFV